MSNRIALVSNFKDYYDDMFSSGVENIVYNREYKEKTRRYQLDMLKKGNVSTVEIVPAYSISSEKCIVFMEHGDGLSTPELMHTYTAKMLYGSYMTTPYKSKIDGYIIKVIVVGKRGFQAIMRGNCTDNLGEKYVLMLSEISEYDKLDCSAPIYSIDYIDTEDGRLAIGCRVHEQLSEYRIDKIMSNADVYKEIEDCIITRRV